MKDNYTALGPLVRRSIITCLCASLGQGMACAQNVNPGFERVPLADNGWNLEVSFGNPTWTVETTGPIRSGARVLRALATTSNERYARHDAHSVLVPVDGVNYVHAIGYALAGTTGDQARMQVMRQNGITAVAGSLTAFSTLNTWQRFVTSGLAENGATYHPGFQFKGNYSTGGDTYRFDDIVIYISESSVADLIAPFPAQGLSVLSNGISNTLSWNDGTDDPLNTSGISGTLILRKVGDHSGSAPVPQPQTWYSTDSGIGPSTINGPTGIWQVVTNDNALAVFTDSEGIEEGVTYAVYMRDRAFNYSEPITVFCEDCAVINPCAPEDIVTVTTTESACDSYTWAVSGTTYNQSGTYIVVNGCQTQELVLTVNPSPQPSIVDVNGVLSTQDYASVQWSLDGVPIDGATGQTHVPTGAGAYTVTVTDNAGCDGVSAPFDLLPVSIQSLASGVLTLMPNPTSGMLFIQGLEGDTEVEILTVDGRLLLRAETRSAWLDLTHVSSGTYLLRVKGTMTRFVRF